MLLIKDLIHRASQSFLFKIIIFLVILGILDFGIGSFLEYYYFRQKSGFLARTNYSIEQTRADILIFGASTANHQYIPEVFERRLNQTAYNVGRDGTSIIYHYALLKLISERYTPKIIILDIRRELAVKSDGYERLSMLLPYTSIHPEINDIIQLKSEHENLKMVSKIYPYNSMLFAILAGISNQFNDRNEDFKGYLPLTRVWKEPLGTITAPILNRLDPNKVKFFESYIQTCVDAGIKLYIVISPNFFKMGYVDIADKKAEEIAKKYNVRFLNYSQDSLFLSNGKLFADIHHLNRSGALVLSNRLADIIINDEKKSNLNQHFKTQKPK